MAVSGNEQIESTNIKDDRRNDLRNEDNLSSNLNNDSDPGKQRLDDHFGLLSIISSHHSEIHLDNSRFKEDPILQSFRLAKSEKVIGLERTEYRYKLYRSSFDTDSSESSVDLNDEDTSDTPNNDLHPTSLKNNHGIRKQRMHDTDNNPVFSSTASNTTHCHTNSLQNSDKSHSSLPPDLNSMS